MKKLISVMLIIVLTLSLAACGVKKEVEETKGGNADLKENSGTIDEESEEKDELEHVTLKFTYPGSHQEDEEKVEKAINEYLKDKINVSIDIEPIDWSAFEEKTSLMMATGDDLDMIFTASWMTYYTDVAKKAYVPLNDLIDKYAPKTKKLLNPALFEGPKVDGIIYGLSTNKETAGATGLFFRKDLVEKYKFDISKIKSIDDFETVLEPMLETIKKNEPGIYPYYSNGYNSLVSFYQPLSIGGGDTPGYYNPDSGKIEYTQESKPKLLLYDLAYKWANMGYINEDAVTAEEWVPNMFCTWMPYKPGKDAEMSAQLGVELVGEVIGAPYTTTCEVTGSMIAISRNSKNPERCMMFLELLNTDKKLNNLLNYGIEDVHYEKVKDNMIDFPEGITASSSTYYPSSQWMFQNQFLNYLRVGEAEDKWEQYDTFNKSAVISPLLGFAFDATPVKSEIAACKNIREEFEKALVSGVLDPAVAVPEYLEKLKANGSEKIVAEKQEQVDEFKAKNK